MKLYQNEIFHFIQHIQIVSHISCHELSNGCQIAIAIFNNLIFILHWLYTNNCDYKLLFMSRLLIFL